MSTIRALTAFLALSFTTHALACEPEDVFCEEPGTVEPPIEDDWSSSFIGLDHYEKAEERAKKKKKRKKTLARQGRPTPTAPQP